MLCFSIAHKPPVIQWLKRYPPITIVARDRSKEFAAAIKEALPKASHVAGRWHVANNLTEHLKNRVSIAWKRLTKVAGEAEMPAEPPPVFPPARRPRQSVGEARYQQMLALKKAGLSKGFPHLCPKSRAAQSGDSGGPDASRKSQGQWKGTSTVSNESNGKRMVELDSPTCNTASCQLPDQPHHQRSDPATSK